MGDDYLVAYSEAFDALTTASYIRKKAPFELIIVINPLGAANIVYASITGTATTTPSAGAGSEPIAPGGAPGVFFLGPGNTSGISVIAATATVGLVLKRVPFPDIAAFFQAIGAYAASAALVSALWAYAAGSTTRIQTLGAVVEASSDTFSGKTVRTNVAVGQPGNATFATPCRFGPSSSDYIEVGANGYLVASSTGAKIYMDNTAVLQIRSGYAIQQMAGAGSDLRHQLSNTGHTHGVTGNGVADQVWQVFRYPIANGQTVAVGDIIVRDSGTNTVRTAGVGGIRPIGISLSTGTGNAGLSVFVDVITKGVNIAAALADAAGVTADQYALPGVVDGTRLVSVATIEGTFAKVINTAASGVPVDISHNGEC